MLQAGFAVVAALAFVLALGAFCVWLLKRFGTGTLLQKSRVPVEVVQRIALGPKVGIAVIRVGEKVMAVSVGDGGVRTLFELDEADRQHILTSSTVPTPLASSVAASADFAKFLPGALATAFGRTKVADGNGALEVEAAPSSVPVPTYAPPASPVVSYARIARAAATTDRDFRAMLNVSLSNATRLVVLIGALAFAGTAASPLRAQGAPPTPPPVQTPGAATGTATGTATGAAAGAPTGAAAAATAIAPSAQQPQLPPNGPTVATPAQAATAATGAPGATPRRGNGATVTPGGARTTRPMTDMQVSRAATDSLKQRAEPAPTAPVAGDDAIMRMMPQMDVKLGDQTDGGLRLSGTVGIVVMMGLLTLLPTLLLMMTGFTRILIVLHFLKQAMGTQGAPPAQLLAGLALLLTGFVMAPTLTQVNREAITPWMDGTIDQVQMMKTGVKPMRAFMLRQTRKDDLKTFVQLSRMPQPNTVDDVPLHVLMSAFVASELRTSFQIGFMIYLPFIIIDAVVASVLMSMGMMMLPPAMISLPFKLLLFVLVDGWSLTIQSLVKSFA